ncbi:MAG TPA: hypothetical protein VMT29_16650 [Steroidobacteraceae bacterium]|nr:hypothetical protein [Steroidobacteraceae bacterium]
MAAAVLEVSVQERLARLESDVAHIRSDLCGLRAEVREPRGSFVQLQKDLADLRVELTQAITSTRIWGLTLTGVVLSVMAHGFHWI